MSDWSAIQGDALETMRGMESATVSLVVADPPYFRVADEDWDHRWKDESAYLSWIGELCDEWRRLLRPNGSLYCFCSPAMAWHVEGEIRRRFDVLNSIIWEKGQSPPRKCSPGDLRKYFPFSERVIFAEQRGGESWAKGESEWQGKCDELRGQVFEPLRAYLDGERIAAGIGKRKCNEACGFSVSCDGMASRHYFSRLQWCLPTAAHYAKLQVLFNQGNGNSHLSRDYEHLRRDYEDKREEYEHLRAKYESLRRPFNLTTHRNATDCWEFRSAKAKRERHPCEKPLAMAEHIVCASSRQGYLLLDPFCGSGVFGEAAVKHGRRYAGIDESAEWVARTKARIETHQPTLFPAMEATR